MSSKNLLTKVLSCGILFAGIVGMNNAFASSHRQYRPVAEIKNALKQNSKTINFKPNTPNMLTMMPNNPKMQHFVNVDINTLKSDISTLMQNYYHQKHLSFDFGLNFESNTDRDQILYNLNKNMTEISSYVKALTDKLMQVPANCFSDVQDAVTQGPLSISVMLAHYILVSTLLKDAVIRDCIVRDGDYTMRGSLLTTVLSGLSNIWRMIQHFKDSDQQQSSNTVSGTIYNYIPDYNGTPILPQAENVRNILGGMFFDIIGRAYTGNAYTYQNTKKFMDSTPNNIVGEASALLSSMSNHYNMQQQNSTQTVTQMQQMMPQSNYYI